MVLTANDAPVDLTGAAARIIVRKDGSRSGAPKVNAVMTIASQVTDRGRVSYAFLPGDVNIAGRFSVEVEVTFADGKVATFPSDGYEALEILDDLA
jgi:hypothetical protein